MPNSVAINGVENLPNEQTLLIYYSILATGNWYLSELLTAYRNVCDTSWTVMYPNHQHPRHTDFPIVVTDPVASCTFAWNYGGIQGISAENFDTFHSYLVQIGIFEYGCSSTGQGGGTEPTGVGTEPTGSTGGTSTGTISQYPGGPGPGGPGGPGGGTPVKVPNLQIDPPLGGSSSGGSTSETGEAGTETGSGSGSSQGEGGEAGSEPGGSEPGGSGSSSQEEPGETGSEPGGIEGPLVRVKLIRDILEQYEEPVSSVILPQIDYNIYLNLQVLSYEVTIGTPIIVSTLFTPPVEITARMVITVQDNSISIPVASSGPIVTGPGRPLTAGGSCSSGLFNLGAVIVIVRVYDSFDQLIAIKSTSVNITEIIQQGSHQVSSVVITEEIPSNILRYPSVEIGYTPDSVSLPEDASKYYIYISDTPQTNFSTILQTRYINDDKYSITVFALNSIAGLSKLEVDNDQIVNNQILVAPVAYSTSKFKINNQEVYPTTHTVAVSDQTITSTNLVVLKISPAIGNVPGDTYGNLYVSKNFYRRPVASSSTSTSVTASVSLANDTYGLIIHGKQPRVVPPDYVVKLSTSNMVGSITWSGLTLTPGDYYSIIESRNGSVNSFDTPVHTSVYQ